MHLWHIGCSFGALAVASIVQAQSSTESYDYDALGRLITVETSGGQNNGEVRAICYDDAGNRTDYEATTGSASLSCAGGTPPPPPPPPPPSTIQITDNNLNVLAAHQSTYQCSIGGFSGYNWEFCSLTSNGVKVYDAYSSPNLDPGYSIQPPKRLDVQSSYYGTGVSP
jgi:YD repeat-containing protein